MTPLFLGAQSLLSQRGTQQGDPLGPMLFCLGIALCRPRPRGFPIASLSPVEYTPTSGIVVLGVPVHPPGESSFIRAHLVKKLDDLRSACARLLRVEDP